MWDLFKDLIEKKNKRNRKWNNKINNSKEEMSGDKLGLGKKKTVFIWN